MKGSFVDKHCSRVRARHPSLLGPGHTWCHQPLSVTHNSQHYTYWHWPLRLGAHKAAVQTHCGKWPRWVAQALHRHWWEAADTKRRTCFLGCPCSCPGDRSSWSKQVCESWAAGWRGSCSLEPARLGIVHKRAVVLHGECGHRSREAAGRKAHLQLLPPRLFKVLWFLGLTLPSLIPILFLPLPTQFSPSP